MNAPVPEQESQWNELYSQLQRLLGASGREDPFGNADFWIVDDNYGSAQQKVCVSRVAFLSPQIAASVQVLLGERYPLWEVLFSLDGTEIRPTPEDQGIVVRSSGVEEHWSRARMAKAHGPQFRWGLRAG